MTENQSNEQLVITQNIEEPKVIYKTSKLAIFLALVSCVATGLLAYNGIWGRDGLIRQIEINHEQNKRLIELDIAKVKLQLRIESLEISQQKIATTLSSLNPTQTSLLLTQINSLINGANQSLLVYHDNASAIQLLKSAEQTINTSSDPLFGALKISLVNDLNNLVAQNNYDSTVLQSQIQNLSDAIAKLQFIGKPIVVTPSIQTGAWSKFIYNVKQNLSSLVEIREVNPNSNFVSNIPEDQLVINQKLQLSILNLRQALFTHNQQIWDTNLDDAALIVRRFYITDVNSEKVSAIISELKGIKLGANNINIDNSLQALSKVNQLYSGK